MLLKWKLIFCFLSPSSIVCFAQQPKLMLPIGHTQIINTAQFSPDGKRVVTASDDKTAKIWDVATGNLLLNLKENSGAIYSAQYSKNGKNIVTAARGSRVKIWDAETGAILREIKDSTGNIEFAQLSPDEKRMLTSSVSDFLKIWDAETGKFLFQINETGEQFRSAQYSPDGKKILTVALTDSAKIWDAETGKFLFQINETGEQFRSAQYSPDGKKILTVAVTDSAKIWDAETGKFLFEMNENKGGFRYTQYSPDGKKFPALSIDNSVRIPDVSSDKFLTIGTDNNVSIWDINTGKLSAVLRRHTPGIETLQFSPDGNKIISSGFSDYNKPATSWVWDVVAGKLSPPVKTDTASYNIVLYSPDNRKVLTTTGVFSGEEFIPDDVKIWDVASGKLVSKLKGADFYKGIIKFSPDGKKILTVSGGFDSPIIWDVNTGKRLVELKSEYSRFNTVQFSRDGKKILTTSSKGSIQEYEFKIWDAITGKVLKKFSDFNDGMFDAQISPDGKKMMIASINGQPRVLDFATYKPLFYLKGSAYVNIIKYSPDGNKIVTASTFTDTIKIWNALTGKLLVTINTLIEGIGVVKFSPDSKKVLSTSYLDKENTVKIWDAENGNLLTELKGHTDIINDVLLSPDGKTIATASEDNTIKKWDAVTGKCLYTFFAVDKDDYLVTDNDNHYDGTEAARKLLYFVCGTEIVSIDQVKDQLWVPGLAERINKGDAINAKSLSDLDICNLTPLVEDISSNTNEYHFSIKPRRGGLGETNVTINGALTSGYQPEELTKNGDIYELKVNKEKINPFFSDGTMNKITVKAYTADNTISSREVIINIDKTAPPAVPPNLYAVMVGVSDYKGETLDLNYAAIDATDVSATVANAAKKLLNTGGNNHVFMYNLTTAKEHYLLPEKISIKKTLEDIGKKATANDILLIFLSGHGVMEGEKKQFYFLTADASPNSLSSITDIAQVGISTAELTEWIKPQNIKAQKRILILDACYSGQAIKDFVDIGNEGQGFIAAKNDDKSQQIKAIDKLNEKSGLFILSASASSQKAYESDSYGHGYLTYSLLKAIKQQPDILVDGGFLNVSRWFNAAEKTVSELAKDDRNKQEPQIVTNTDFNIGLVDEEVMGKIVLSAGKPLFAASIFFNTDITISDDNLELSKLMNKQLAGISSGGADSKIVYAMATNAPEAYSLTGRYEIKGNTIIVKANIKQGKQIKNRFQVNGSIDRPEELAAAILEKAVEWAANNK